MTASTPSTMFLKLASAMNYTFTTEERKFLKNEGTCVEDNLLGIYNPLIKWDRMAEWLRPASL